MRLVPPRPAAEASQTSKAFGTSGLTEYLGFGGGEVSRTVLDNSGAGLAFFADFFVPDAVDVGGYVDTRQTVRGAWQIEPIINPETTGL